VRPPTGVRSAAPAAAAAALPGLRTKGVPPAGCGRLFGEQVAIVLAKRPGRPPKPLTMAANPCLVVFEVQQRTWTYGWMPVVGRDRVSVLLRSFRTAFVTTIPPPQSPWGRAPRRRVRCALRDPRTLALQVLLPVATITLSLVALGQRP